MTFVKTISALAVSSAILAVSTGIAAAGPMQNLSISKNGIDAVPIEVSVVGGSFKKIKSPSHKFLLKIYAKAKLAKKVKVAQVTTSDAPYLEADPGTWSMKYYPNKRTFSKSLSPVIAMSKVRWSGADPIQACNNKLKSSRNILTKGTTTQATAYFQLHASNKNGLKGLSDSKHNSTWMWYPVQVKCLPNAIGGKLSN
ncbi:hypothetical protein [Lentilitoribacter sp. EG35]|jgi:hypothetical protein|uniref:hypothetical protein n=1 Tax=Lentilitoribacter sp. EG35 TaxID=3234192 RepID=UPI003460702B